jgi:hypothetical protein
MSGGRPDRLGVEGGVVRNAEFLSQFGNCEECPERRSQLEN